MKKKTKTSKKIKARTARLPSSVKKSRAVSKVKISNQSGLTPLGDRVVLKPLSADEGARTISGIIIPETIDKERPEQARVVAVGPGRYENGELIPLSVKVGDVVVFSKYGFDEIKHRGEEYYILKEDSILAVIK